ncbi:MAG: HD domain-containing protein [Nanoarchaeota archaeon]|nr:HD domain-containing protein [Nanoarchaeota archaeon]
MLSKIKSMVLELCEGSKWNWKGHITSVVKYSRLLAKKTGADVVVCETAAWLHDVVKITGTREGHHIKGSEKAEEILRDMGYDKEFIGKVKHCILTHSSDEKYPPESKEAKIVAAADALSHFDNFMSIAHGALVTKGLSTEDARELIIKKYETAWKKVNLLPEAAELGRKRYEAIMLILRS